MVGLKIILVSTFMMHYEKMKNNEENIFQNELVLKDYYSEFSDRLRLFHSSQVCVITYERNPPFNVEGCEDDLDSMMKEGLRECVSIIITNLYTVYYSFINDHEVTMDDLKEKYVNDTLIVNLGIFG